jgi:hypothetical protein
MQRQTLVPLHHHMRSKPPGGVGMKCLEVACGTGRFATFIKVVFCSASSCSAVSIYQARAVNSRQEGRMHIHHRLAQQDNYPEMDITCLDLSPFYLEKSRENMDYWRRMRAPASQKNTTDAFIQVGDECW